MASSNIKGPGDHRRAKVTITDIACRVCRVCVQDNVSRTYYVSVCLAPLSQLYRHTLGQTGRDNRRPGILLASTLSLVGQRSALKIKSQSHSSELKTLKESPQA